MFVEVLDINQLNMAFSLIESITKVMIGLIIGGVIGIPITIIIWKRKMKKIKRSMPKNMEEKIKIFKISEKGVEDERIKKEKLREDRRNQRAADTIKSINGNTIKNLTGREITGGKRELPKANVDFIKRTKSSSKGNWPSFE